MRRIPKVRQSAPNASRLLSTSRRPLGPARSSRDLDKRVGDESDVEIIPNPEPSHLVSKGKPVPRAVSTSSVRQDISNLSSVLEERLARLEKRNRELQSLVTVQNTSITSLIQLMTPLATTLREHDTTLRAVTSFGNNVQRQITEANAGAVRDAALDARIAEVEKSLANLRAVVETKGVEDKVMTE